MADTVVNGINVPFLPIGGTEGLKERSPIALPEDRKFENVLQSELAGLKFSKHAKERLEAEQTSLNEADLSSLQKAVTMAKQKGSAESLVLLRDMAFIVNVNNQTVVTAVGRDRMRDNVFTNIDSAVIAG